MQNDHFVEVLTAAPYSNPGRPSCRPCLINSSVLCNSAAASRGVSVFLLGTFCSSSPPLSSSTALSAVSSSTDTPSVSAMTSMCPGLGLHTPFIHPDTEPLLKPPAFASVVQVKSFSFIILFRFSANIVITSLLHRFVYAFRSTFISQSVSSSVMTPK